MNRLQKTAIGIAALMMAAMSFEGMAHGTKNLSGRTGEHKSTMAGGGCSAAKSEAKDAIEAACKRLPAYRPAVEWWGVVSWETSRCNRRGPFEDSFGEYYFEHVTWSVRCGPHGDRDHSRSYHDPNDSIGPDHSH